MEKIVAGDPETGSADVVAGKLERLKTLFPEAFTDGRMDFEVLRQLLGDTVNESEEKYGLNWHGKRRARQVALMPSTGTLRPCPEDSVDWHTTQNLMIEGDNLEVLKLLQKSYTGKVKLIYIDPPYNTGKEFVYPDDYRDNLYNYLKLTGQADQELQRLSSNTNTSGRFHADWLSMMYPRLKVARNLLSNDGFILISIDDNEESHLRVICDELFGPENFLSTICWRRKKESSNDGKGFAIKGEFLLAFRRNEEGETNRLPLSESYLRSSYRDPTNEYPEDRWRPVPIAVTKGHQSGGYRYSITTPKGTTYDRSWLYPEKSFQDLVDRHRIYWGKDYDGIPQRVMYARESTGTLPDNIWLDVATNKEGKKELTDLFGVDAFDTVKPVALIEHALDICTGPDSLILDFFAGSGTTAQAVIAKNCADNGNRRYILVQLPEPLDPNNKSQKIGAEFCDQLGMSRNIAELTKERLRRAARKIQRENPNYTGDFGFRVFKLDTSNIRTWDPKPDDLEGALLSGLDHIEPGRTEQDILFELLLKLGLDLCVPIETQTIAGKSVHSVGAGTLIACLDEDVSRDDVEPLATGIADWHDALAPAGECTVVFRDSAFADDVAKTNLAETLKQSGLGNVRSL